MSYGLACASICTIFLVAKVVTVIDLYLNLAGSHHCAPYIFLLHDIHRSVAHSTRTTAYSLRPSFIARLEFKFCPELNDRIDPHS